jgi:hypothetical protein
MRFRKLAVAPPIRHLGDVIPEGFQLVLPIPDIGSLKKRNEIAAVLDEELADRKAIGLHQNGSLEAMLSPAEAGWAARAGAWLFKLEGR